MSVLTEWLKLIPAGLQNIDKVAEGVMNNIKLEHGGLSEEEQQEIFRRRIICATCPFMSENAKAAGAYYSKREDEHCTHCGCPITTKTASLTSNCGIEFYNNRNPEAPMELKWEAFKK